MWVFGRVVDILVITSKYLYFQEERDALTLKTLNVREDQKSLLIGRQDKTRVFNNDITKSLGQTFFVVKYSLAHFRMLNNSPICNHLLPNLPIVITAHCLIPLKNRSSDNGHRVKDHNFVTSNSNTFINMSNFYGVQICLTLIFIFLHLSILFIVSLKIFCNKTDIHLIHL